MKNYTRLNLGFCTCSSTSYADACHAVSTLALAGQKCSVYFMEGNLLSLVPRDLELANVLQSADLVFPDGIAVAKLAKLRTGQEPSRVSGPTFMLEMCDKGREQGLRHFFLGGAPGVADHLAEKMKTRFPGIQVAGTFCPPFRKMTEPEEASLAQRIEAAQPHLLWVALGGPKQEFWIRDHLKTLDVPIMLGVGAAFDFHAGTRPWAPKLVRNIGLEWLWRMLSGGRKTALRNIRCVSVVAGMLGVEYIKSLARKKPLPGVGQ